MSQNGKGSKYRPKSVDQKTWTRIGIEFLQPNRKAKLMSSGNGIKVLIKSKDSSGKSFTEYGYIVNRIDAHCYHIVSENSNKEYFLDKDEFQEIEENNLLYGIRDKIR